MTYKIITLSNFTKLLKKSIMLSDTLILIFILIFYSASTMAISEKDFNWKIYKQKKGITIYKGKAKKHENFSGITPLKFSTIINFPISKVIWVMANSKRKKQWVPNLIKSYPIQINGIFNRLEYSIYDSPWPFDDRTFLVQSTGFINKKDKEVKIIFKSVLDKRAPLKKEFVRANTHLGSIKFYPLDQYKKTYFEMIILTDFNGNIPKWIINMVQLRWPFRFIKLVNKQLSKKDIVIPEKFLAKNYLE